MEFVVGIIGFTILALFSYYTDKSRKSERKRDYYDG